MIFDLHEIVQKTGLQIKGVLHIGGFVGEEAKLYRSLGVVRAVFFEPQSAVYPICKKNASGYIVEKMAVGNIEGEIEMNISYTEGGVENGSGASSSILEPKLHLTEHPHIKFPLKEIVPIVRLDDYLARKKGEGKYNLINIDVQGYELEVLRGASHTLQSIDAAIIEVNRAPMYEGCPMVCDIDDYMAIFGLKRLATVWATEFWGDAYYCRDTYFDRNKS